MRHSLPEIEDDVPYSARRQTDDQPNELPTAMPSLSWFGLLMWFLLGSLFGLGILYVLVEGASLLVSFMS